MIHGWTEEELRQSFEWISDPDRIASGSNIATGYEWPPHWPSLKLAAGTNLATGTRTKSRMTPAIGANLQSRRPFSWKAAAIQDHSSIAAIDGHVPLPHERQFTGDGDGCRSTRREDGRVESDGVAVQRPPHCLPQGAGTAVGSAGHNDGPI